jgi:hypothetical protein
MLIATIHTKVVYIVIANKSIVQQKKIPPAPHMEILFHN